jgi:hypothetical protein
LAIASLSLKVGVCWSCVDRCQAREKRAQDTKDQSYVITARFAN